MDAELAALEQRLAETRALNDNIPSNVPAQSVGFLGISVDASKRKPQLFPGFH
jgi:hypothetical protein